MRLFLVGLLLLTASACKDEAAKQDRAKQDARDVAQVEAAQKIHPPLAALRPEPIAFADIEAHNLFGAGCSLTPKAEVLSDPVVLADSDRAVIKLDGKLVLLAADRGSATMPYDSVTHYVGKAQTLRLGKDPGEGKQHGEESMRWNGRVTIRDAYDRVVYLSDGWFDCGA